MTVVKSIDKNKTNKLFEKIKNNPDLLKSESLENLKSLWKYYHPRKQAPKVKLLLIIELSYIIQSKQHGGIDKATAEILNQIKVKFIKKQDTKNSKTKNKTPRPKHTLALEHGTTLKRIFNGREHQVQISIADNKQTYFYNNTTYKSLSKIARLITGTHLSGPRFFGLTRNIQNKSKMKSLTNQSL